MNPVNTHLLLSTVGMTALLICGSCTTATSFRPADAAVESQDLEAKPEGHPIPVYSLENPAPEQLYRAIGTLKIRDTGFTTIGGSLDAVIAQAKREARERGADAIQITRVFEPDSVSTIYRIDACLLCLRGDWPHRSLTEADVIELLEEDRKVDPVEGIWSAQDQSFRVAIVPDDKGGAKRGFVGFVLDVAPEQPLWQAGFVRIDLTPAATSGVYVATYHDERFRRNGSVVTLSVPGLLTIPPSTDASGVILVKMFPPVQEVGQSPDPDAAASSGTGFFLTRSGLVLTNWHVVEDKHTIRVEMPNLEGTFGAEVVAKDVQNDLAVIQVSALGEGDSQSIEVLPLASASTIALGDPVFTVGYPLTDILGSSPKLTSGEVSGLSGPDDDPRLLQISVPVQPGNSGGPLVNTKGQVIGVVVSTLDPRFTWAFAGSLPQNVNFAIKADYISTLLRVKDLRGDEEAPLPEVPREAAIRSTVRIAAN